LQNHSFLLAVQEELEVLLPQMVVERVDYEERQLWVNGTAIDLDKYPAICGLDRVIERQQMAVKVLGFDSITEEQALLRAILQSEVEGDVYGQYLQAKKVYYYARSRVKISCVKVDPLKPSHNYQLLLAAKCLTDGHLLTEYKAKYFVITAPSGVDRTATKYNCTCDTWSELKTCQHQALAAVAADNRADLYKLKLLELKD
jgi:hypothetical protein